VALGMVVGGLSFLAYVFVTQSWMVLALIAFSALQGLVFPSMNALLSRMTDASHQGALQGGMSSIGGIAAIIGPVATNTRWRSAPSMASRAAVSRSRRCWPFPPCWSFCFASCHA
jgi:hypothetical protein